VDALQLVVALDKNYGLKIADPASAREILRSVETIALALAKQRDAPPGGEARGAEAVTS
jgi:acyl carrier protein